MKIAYLQKLFLCLLLHSLSAALPAQSFYEILRDPGDRTFDEIRDHLNRYYETHDKGRGSGFKQFKRWEWMMEPRVYPSGKLINPVAKRFEASQEALHDVHLNGTQKTQTNTWVPIGPTDYIPGQAGDNGGLGRVNVLAFDAVNPNIMYAGTPTGGLWRKGLNGNTWECISNSVSDLGVSGIALHPTNNQIIYILTGDGDGTIPLVPTAGVLKTMDGGASWNTTGTLQGMTTGVRGHKLLMHPTNPQIIYAATSIGVQRTQNGGASWSMVQSGHFYDLEFKPGNPNTIYACTNSQLWRSTSGGNSGTWSSTTLGPSNSDRAAIAVTPGSPNTIFAIVANSSGGMGSFQRSDNSGVSFTTLSTEKTPNLLDFNFGNGSGGQGCYDLALAVSQGSANIVHVGGVNHWQSNDGGLTWTQISYWRESSSFQYTHADIHALEWGGSHLWCGSDGGVFQKTNGFLNWADRSEGLNIHQIYTIADIETISNPDFLYVGTQDNGTNKYLGNGVVEHQYLGDGTDVLIHANNPNIVYSGFFFGQRSQIVKTTNAGASWDNITPSTQEQRNLVPPLEQNLSNPNIMYWGARNVYKTTNGTNFVRLNNTGVSQPYRAIKVAGVDPNWVYAVSPSEVKRSTDGGTSWINISAGLPLGQAMPVAFAITNNSRNRAYIGFSGYASGTKVYRTVDGGLTWSNVSMNLPNVPINDLEIAQGRGHEVLFAATDMGVYAWNLSWPFIPWQQFATGLPTSMVTDLEYHAIGGKLRAATYGRGTWEIDFVPPGPTRREMPVVGTDNSLTDYVGPMPGVIMPLAGGNLESSDLSAFPNPASERSLIDFTLPADKKVNIALYNLNGQRLQQVVADKPMTAGRYRTTLQVRDLAAGTYLLTLTTETDKRTQKIVVRHP